MAPEVAAVERKGGYNQQVMINLCNLSYNYHVLLAAFIMIEWVAVAKQNLTNLFLRRLLWITAVLSTALFVIVLFFISIVQLYIWSLNCMYYAIPQR